MSYKIAIGSSDGVNIDLKFGEVSEFLIYEVEGINYKLIEKRKRAFKENNAVSGDTFESSCDSGCCKNGNRKKCQGPKDITSTIEVIKDCRCILCKKVGFQAQKQFEKKLITVFDIEYPINQALKRIVFYYNSIDNNRSWHL
ncbi:NifB/NifX family molybdenum-iron cluster-binding protein [Lachnobacterium bovis]|uniref:Dinitrogenase iron-molybdenum cofactor n=1 Tax=Lachnobacterium bovis DSM 14045 TaxID=1122142 RepID=A0A1H3JBU8_9FIRM|nr:NifB/NifX family molybdenum-iron cluster-binding protein [Lachnobacterium bovis]SDY37297.1 Dinitrogenase iron-molybdenum cofactor [Lachnobacterium bovis DSM 14045]